MKHTHDSDKNEAELDIDQRLAGPASPAEGDYETSIISSGSTHADTVLTVVSPDDYRQAHAETHGMVEPLPRHLVTAIEDQTAPVTTVLRKPRAKRRSRNHDLLNELRMLQGKLYAEFVVITATAIESGMRCDRWSSKYQLMEELNVLIDVGCQTTDSEDSAYVECVEMASRMHENCRSIQFWGETIALRHYHDVHDRALGISLRLHFATESHSCRIILGWIEEIQHGEPSRTNHTENSAVDGHAQIAA